MLSLSYYFCPLPQCQSFAHVSFFPLKQEAPGGCACKSMHGRSLSMHGCPRRTPAEQMLPSPSLFGALSPLNTSFPQLPKCPGSPVKIKWGSWHGILAVCLPKGSMFSSVPCSIKSPGRMLSY